MGLSCDMIKHIFGVPLCPLLGTFFTAACTMAKSKKKHRSSSRKFKELEGHMDDLGAEVIQIERAYLPYIYASTRHDC
jgi:hypothetical protein